MIQEMLPYVGIALQWARAQKKFGDLLYLLIVAGASFGFYAIANQGQLFAAGWPDAWWLQAQAILAFVQLTSSSANIVNGMRGNQDAPPLAIPVTNSQG